MGKPPSDAQSATIQHFSHPHTLNLTCRQSQAALVPPTCSCCKKRVDSWAYGCEYCKFFLHTECSRLPPLVNHQFHPVHNLTLLVNDKDSNDCAACGESGEGFSYNCSLCSLNLHTACSVMPMDLFSPCHLHQLALMACSPYPTKTFSCDLCRAIGSKWLYRCNACEFDAHLKCAKEAKAPPMRVSPAMNIPATAATVQVPMIHSNNMRVNSQHMVVPSGPSFNGGFVTSQNSGYTAAPGQYPVGYHSVSQVRPTAMPMQMQMQMQPGAYSGSVMQPVLNTASFNAQSGYMPSAGYPSQYTVPPGYNVNAVAGGNSLANQYLNSAISGAVEGLVSSLSNGGGNNGGGNNGGGNNGGSNNGGGDTFVFMDGGCADTAVVVDSGGSDTFVFMDT